MDRHRMYALESAARQGNRQAAQELAGLRPRMTPLPSRPRVPTESRPAEPDLVAAETGEPAPTANRVSVVEELQRPPTGDGVVIMRLGSRPPVEIRVEPSSARRGARNENSDWRDRAFNRN